MSSSKKLPVKGLAAGVYLSEALYVHIVYLFTQGREDGGEMNQKRRGEGQQFTIKPC
jgi:hypothetical protein